MIYTPSQREITHDMVAASRETKSVRKPTSYGLDTTEDWNTTSVSFSSVEHTSAKSMSVPSSSTS